MNADREHAPGCALAPAHPGECIVPKPARAIRAMRTGRPRPGEPEVREQTDERILRRQGRRRDQP